MNNVKNIFQKSVSYSKSKFKYIALIYLSIELIMLIIDIIPNQLIAIFLGLLSTTLLHAYAYTSLKIIRNDEKSIKYKDTFIGIFDFIKLFPSYMMRRITLNTVSLLLLFPSLLLIRFKTGFSIAELLDWIRLIVVSGIDNLNSVSLIQEYLTTPFLYLSVFVSFIISNIIAYGLSMMPFLVQEYDISWLEAMQKSWSMMKGHKREYFVLKLWFLPRQLLSFFTITFFSTTTFLPEILRMVFTFLSALYIPVILYLPQIEISTALFYEKLVALEEKPDLFKL